MKALSILESEERSAREALLQAWRDHNDASENAPDWRPSGGGDLSEINSRARVLGIRWAKADAELRAARARARDEGGRTKQSAELKSRLMGGVLR